MKYSNRRRVSALVLVGVHLVAGVANAALTQIQVSYYTDYTGIITGATIGTHFHALTSFSAKRTDGDPLPQSHSNPFTTFCLDATANLIPTGWWKTESLANAGLGNQATYQAGGIQRAASLYNGFV